MNIFILLIGYVRNQRILSRMVCFSRYLILDPGMESSLLPKHVVQKKKNDNEEKKENLLKQ